MTQKSPDFRQVLPPCKDTNTGNFRNTYSELTSNSKVCKFGMALCIKQDISCLDVSEIRERVHSLGINKNGFNALQATKMNNPYGAIIIISSPKTMSRLRSTVSANFNTKHS